VSIKGQLGRAVMRRLEAMPSVRAVAEREERLAPTRQAAMSAASSTADDETARMSLRAQLTAPADVLREAAVELSKDREDYVHDRAYRLLSAAAADGPVQPIPPERSDLFDRERALGSMPMGQAYRELASIEPGLQRIEQRVRAGEHEREADGRSALGKEIDQQLRELVGGGATRDDELLRTTLAGSLARQYLWILSGATQFGTADDSFYQAPLRTFVSSTVIRRSARDQA